MKYHYSLQLNVREGLDLIIVRAMTHVIFACFVLVPILLARSRTAFWSRSRKAHKNDEAQIPSLFFVFFFFARLN